MNINSVIIHFLVISFTVIANEPIFYDIGVDDISSTSTRSVGVTTTYNTSTNTLIIDTLVQNRGCGVDQAPYALYYIQNNIVDVGIPNITWSYIRYTTQFYGAASCWSILGDTTRYYDFYNITSTGLYPFDNDTDTLIINELRGSWANDVYELARCDNDEVNNMWRVSGDYKGKVRVEQRRDLSQNMAGISFSASCTIPGVTRVKFSDIQIGYILPTPMPTMEPSMEPTEEPTLEPIIGDGFDFEDEEKLFGEYEHIGIGVGFGCVFVIFTYVVAYLMKKKEPSNPKIESKHKVNAHSTNMDTV